MPTTTQDSIYYADGTTPASLADITAAMATSVQNALLFREMHSFSWANATERGAQTGMIVGDIGYQIDNLVYYRYDGTAWRIWHKAPAAYTPTFTAFTPSATSFVYSIASGVVRITGRATCGTTLPTGSITFTTPANFNIDLTSVSASISAIIGTGGVDAATDHPLGFRVTSASTVSAVAFNAAGTYLTVVATSAAIPKTWASSDVMYVNFSYPVST